MAGARLISSVKEEIGENGSLAYHELILLLVEDHGTDHVGGQQVGGKLDAAEFPADSLCKGFDRQRFGQSGYTLQQDMAIGEQPDQQTVQHVLLPHDHATDFCP